MDNHYAPPKSAVADVTQHTGEVHDRVVDELNKTKPWATFIMVVLFILAAFMMLAMAAMLLGGIAMSSFGAPGDIGMIMAVMGVVIGVVGVIYVLLGVFLQRFTTAIGRLWSSNRQHDLITALNQQRKFWMLAGIVSILMTLFTLGYYGVLYSMPEIWDFFNAEL